MDNECKGCDYRDGQFTTEDNTCEEICGDGIFLDETSECDDGNTDSGDGCSATCTVEVGYRCEGGTKCREVIPPVLQLQSVE